MVKLKAAELWEEVRREGALTPQVEAQLAKERAEAVQIILSDLENRVPFQLKSIFDDMNDEQLSQMLNQLNTSQLAGLAGYLKPVQLTRAQRLIKSDSHRRLLQLIVDTSDQ